LQCRGAVEDGIPFPPAIMQGGEADGILEQEPLSKLRQRHRLVVGDIEDDALHRLSSSGVSSVATVRSISMNRRCRAKVARETSIATRMLVSLCEMMMGPA
jgi:thiamine monophosphate synthase